MDQLEDDGQLPVQRHGVVEAAARATALDDRGDLPEHGLVQRPQALGPEPRVDGHQRVVAPEHPPCRADDALERLDRLSDRDLAALMAAALSAIARS